MALFLSIAAATDSFRIRHIFYAFKIFGIFAHDAACHAGRRQPPLLIEIATYGLQEAINSIITDISI